MVFLYLSHFSRVLLDPFVLALALLAGSLLLRRFKRGSFFLALGAFLLLVVPGSSVISNRLAASLEDQYPDPSMQTIPQAQAIVVLGGSLKLASEQHPASHLVGSSDRLLVALRLYRARKAPLILCSGGNLSLFKQPSDDPPEARAMSGLLQEWGLPASAILTEEKSVNTHQNATMSFDLLSARKIHKIILVTSAIHMPRAAATFRRAGFEVVPAPADFYTGWDGDDLSWIPSCDNLESTEMALREWVGLWVYRSRGWA
ncbi:MAG TPA: YdcF family protein [Terracidiphilus sp.]|nr:YdcF family protein [Terracidiphilus sp.]